MLYILGSIRVHINYVIIERIESCMRICVIFYIFKFLSYTLRAHVNAASYELQIKTSPMHNLIILRHHSTM